jgi:glycosyltransferase involved in cell wall biosynthesis
MPDKQSSITYVLITPARNEEASIEKTIKSVVNQTILPEKWIIVSDGSTDRTDAIVQSHQQKYDFIHLVRRDADVNRDFASKVYAIRAGLEKLNGTRYDFIGNLDADVSFEQDFYERIFREFDQNPELGITGGVFYELNNGQWTAQRTNVNWSVGGCTQTFRRQCYQDIGGYLPLKKGGEDAIAEVLARRNGWQVRALPDLKIFHYRKIGSMNHSYYRARINHGAYHYSLGYMLWYEVARTFSRLRKSYVLAEFATLFGYLLALIRRDAIAVPEDVHRYIREEQVNRLKQTFRTKMTKFGKKCFACNNKVQDEE